MRRAQLAFRLVLALVLMACGAPSGSSTLTQDPAGPKTQTAPVTPTALASDPSLARLARSCNAFGFDLYQRLRLRPGNLIVSPASLSMALTLTWGGAKGETAEEMRRALHLEGTAENVMRASGELARRLQDPARKGTLRIANQLFGEQSYTFEPAYLEQARAAFGAPLEAVDFRGQAEAARVRINGWVAERTERRIENLVPPGAIDAETRLALVNAIYFLGRWEDPFDASATRPAPFFLAANRKRDVPTMSQTGAFRIAQQGGVTALELPYEGGGLAMLLLVPDEVEGLAEVEKDFDAARLEALVGALRRERVWVALPRLTLDPAEPLSLGDELRALGMARAFDRGRADFTGIANPPNPEDRLVLAKVFHKGFVRVDEAGTEAAAATAVIAQRAGGMPERPRFFRADRPFLFLIRDPASGLVLFLGRVTDPGAR